MKKKNHILALTFTPISLSAVWKEGGQDYTWCECVLYERDKAYIACFANGLTFF